MHFLRFVTHAASVVVDMKPERLEDLTEVITSAEFHPNHCSIMAYTSSKGFVRISDLRVHSLADKAPRGTLILPQHCFKPNEN